MKYKYFLILFLAVWACLGHITFSDSKTASSTDTESWWIKNMPEAAIITELNATQKDLYELSYSEKRFSNIEDTFNASRTILSQTREDLERYVEKIEEMQRDIRDNIDKSNEQKKQLEEEILLLDTEIQNIRSRQEETKKYIKKILIDDHRIGLEESADLSMYGLLFGKNLGKQLSERDILNTLKDSSTQLLERQKSIEEQLNKIGTSKNIKIDAKKRIIWRLENYGEELKDTEELKKMVLSQTIEEQNLQKKIAKVAQKKKSISVKIETKFAEYEKSLQEKITQYNCDSQKSSVCIWIQGYMKAEKNLIKAGIIIDTWQWPVDPKNGFWYHFRDQKYFHLNNIHHNWLDIIVEPGIPVKSMGNGYLLMKQHPSSNFPGIVIIKHPNWFMSMYTGVVPWDMAIFTQINSGDIIATSREYMEHSGKNNVHIELYENGTLTDPLEKLDLSNVQTHTIPARYGWKYIDDSKNMKKTIDTKTLQKNIWFFYLEWENEAERQKKLLETYASKDFQDRDIWVQESLAERIDPSFVLCVGLAESTLGKNLTTDGNIGNVGNTDSWARRDYKDPRSGIRAISAVVNNTWLWGYTSIDQLSGWGNPVGPIYASSETNWHENIVKCMSAIKGRYVWNKANFRLSQASLLLYEREWFIWTIPQKDYNK
jgi:murein DD-endopeptidase MepM/ murein hydrolase activator NlpD